MTFIGFAGCIAFMFSVGAIRQQLGTEQASLKTLSRTAAVTRFVEYVTNKTK